MRRPEVTIVVPIYNGSAYLRETLDALLAQSFEDFELLAIDDGSLDGSGGVVRSYKDSRVRLIHKENTGLCETLNRGIAEARGRYLARNDQDDVSVPQRLERQIRVMREHPEALGLFAFHTKFGGKHGWANADKLKVAEGVVRRYEPLKDGCLLGSTMFARTEALRSIGGFRHACYPADDWDLECRLSEAGEVLVLCEALVAYRFQTGANTYRLFSVMQQKSRWVRDSYQRRMRGEAELSFEDFTKGMPADGWSRLNRHRLDAARLHMRTAGQHYLDGRYAAAAGRLSAALILNAGDFVQRARRLLGGS